MEKVDITIIGAGIIGLSLSASLAESAQAVYVLEKNSAFGQESSSRNSEVLHAGLYYPPDSLKAATCVEGNRMAYQICNSHNIPCKKVGKLIVACSQQELTGLDQLLQNGQRCGVPGLKLLSQKEIKQLEPKVKAEAALYSPSTGIVDSHNLMYHFSRQAKAAGVEFAFQTEVQEIDKGKGGYQLTVRDPDGSEFSFFTRILINCAGLNSDLIAKRAGIDINQEGYTLKFCKGEYFRVTGNKSGLITHLVYPVPDDQGISLGIHATPDLGGGLRLGPDAEYIDRAKADYEIDPGKKEIFAQEVSRFLPFITADDLSADTCGIRPKLQGPDEEFRDFVIADETDKGFPGLINLVGIDSPGLTCAPAIAQHVRGIVEKMI